MHHRIPIIGPREAKLLFHYFVSIDRCLAGRFLLGFPPDEEHLTSLLTELLDERGSQLHPLQYSLRQLNDELRASESLLQVDLSISTNKYNRYQESNATQADLGIVLDYRDYIQADLSFQKGALFQAKRLFPNTDNKYGLSSEYQAYREKQHSAFALLDLKEGLNEPNDLKGRGYPGRGCFYLLYNPSMSNFETGDQERMRHRQIRHDTSSIFDYTHGLHLYHQLLGGDSVQAFADIASLVCNLDSVKPRDLGGKPRRTKQPPNHPKFDQILESNNLRQSSLPWFLVFDFMLGEAGNADREFLNLVWSGGSVRRQQDARIEFAAPRYTLNLRMEAGRNSDRRN